MHFDFANFYRLSTPRNSTLFGHKDLSSEIEQIISLWTSAAGKLVRVGQRVWNGVSKDFSKGSQMKKAALCSRRSSLVVLTAFVLARSQITYYVSSEGDNGNDGSSAQKALQTIEAVNAKTLSAGDSVLFRRGDVFVGQLEATQSGSSSAPIYYGAYGSGENPVISGAVTDLSFSQAGGVFEVSSGSTVKVVHIENVRAVLAREPNDGFYPLSSVTKTSLSDPAHLNEPADYFKGANIRMRSKDWTFEARTLTSSGNGTVRWNGNLFYTPGEQWGYYLDNHRSFLDAENEWYYDETAQKLFVHTSSDLTDTRVYATVHDYGINFRDNVSNISIENLMFKYQALDGVRVNGRSSNITVSGCAFIGIEKHGFSCHTLDNSRIVGNRLEDVNGTGIYCHKITNTVIADNLLKRIGLVPGFGQVGTFPLNNNAGISSANGANNHVHHNSIDSTGYSGIRTDGSGNVVENNYIRNALLTLTDGGGFYCWGDHSRDGVVRNNVIVNTLGGFDGKPNHHNIAVGIYFDNKVHGMTAENNIIINSGTLGILCNQGTRSNTLKGNTVFEFGNAGILFPENTADYSNVGNVISGNTIVGLADTVKCVSKKTNNTVDNYNPGQWKNNLYVNPYTAIVAQSSKVGGKHVHRELPLEAWEDLVDESGSRSLFFGWNRFEPTDTTGNEMVTNGTFDDNVNGWGSWSNGDKEMRHINSSELDGKALQFEITSDNNIGFSIAGLQDGFTKDQWYQVSFSIVSEQVGNVIVTPKRNFSPYSGILYRKVPFFTSRMDYNFTFQANDNVDPARMDFQISSEDKSYSLDNVSVLPVSVSYRDPQERIMTFYNASDETKQVQLDNHKYEDFDNNEYCGTIELTPWSARVLVRKDAECTSTATGQNGLARESGVGPAGLRYSLGENSFLITSDEPISDVSVRDGRGRRIARLGGPQQKQCRIPLDNISHGVYFITITTPSEHRTIRQWFGGLR